MRKTQLEVITILAAEKMALDSTTYIEDMYVLIGPGVRVAVKKPPCQTHPPETRRNRPRAEHIECGFERPS